jgi:hypothetical protein
VNYGDEGDEDRCAGGEGLDGGGGRSIRELRRRIDGFTPERQKIFLKTLRKTGCVRDSARAARVSTTTIDRARRCFADFDEKCRAARELAVPNLEAIAYRRATVGAAARIVRKGKLFEVRVKPSDSMLRLLLAGAAPKKYGRFAGLPAAKRADERKRPGWMPHERSPEEVRESILTKLEAIARHRIEHEGYRLGPGGELLAPGMRLVSEEELRRLGWTDPDFEEGAGDGGGGGGGPGPEGAG